MSKLDYYDEKGLSAVFYDALTARDPTMAGDVQFYEELLLQHADVLELGCGTGRVAVALAAKGHNVCGIDRASSMLKQAEIQRRKLPVDLANRLTFQRGDITTLVLNRLFDAVIAPFFVLNHIEEGQRRAQAMRAVAEHLKPGGIAAIHVASPDALRASAEKPIDQQTGYKFQIGATGFHAHIRPVSIRIRGELFTQIILYSVSDQAGRVTRQAKERLTFAIIDDVEMERVTEAAGLRIDRVDSKFHDHGAEVHRIFILSHVTRAP